MWKTTWKTSENLNTEDLGSFGGDDSADEETNAPFSWRLSPAVSLSDWKIRVKMKTGLEVIETYHVHRNILGVGVRSCNYFSKIFTSSQNFSESGASDLTFENTAVDAFPAFLDYVYTGELSVCTASAVALLDLANYLGCKAAYKEAQKFIRVDLSKQTSPMYIREASKYGADKILAAALKICASNFETIEPALLICLPPDLFVGLVTGSGFKCKSEVLSERVVSYLENHVDEVNGDLVGVLTSSKLMPRVDIVVALQLLRLGLEHGVANEDGAPPPPEEEEEEEEEDEEGAAPAMKKQKAGSEGKGSVEEESMMATTAESVVSLQQRCFKSLHTHFDVLRASNLEGLPADVTIALLKGGLDAAASAKDEAAKKYAEEAKRRVQTAISLVAVQDAQREQQRLACSNEAFLRQQLASSEAEKKEISENSQENSERLTKYELRYGKLPPAVGAYPTSYPW